MEINKVQVQQLYSGIFLNKKMVFIDQQLYYIFELDVQDLNIIDFQIDFKGSENISIKGYGSETTTVFRTVEPRTSLPNTIAQVQLQEGWKLKTVFRFLRKPIPKEKQMNFIKSSTNQIETQKKSIGTLFKKIEVGLTSIQELTSMLEKSKIKFVDVEFPPEQVSILGDSDKNLIDDTVNHWRRPFQIFQSKAYHLIDRINIKNLVMGKILDHAFYSVVCTLAMTHRQLIERLFLNQKNINESGIYRILLCKNGEWQTVTIDDYLPCQPFSKPKFASSTLTQIWFSLLQKAYAKLHGRYLALNQLEVSHVFTDLTGCPTTIISLQKEGAIQKLITNFKLKYIVAFYNIDQSEFDEDQFTALKQYAYPMTSYQVQNKKHYIKFYSHNQNQQELSEDDLGKKFKYACICKIQNWEQVRIKGKFISIDVSTSQVPNNSMVMSRWYYSLQIHEQSQVYFCLHQEDLLIKNNIDYKKYKFVTIVVFNKGEKSKLNPIFLKKFSHNRQFQFNINLKPGIYLIVPIINQELSNKKPANQSDLVSDIYRKLDLLMRRSLKYEELQIFYKAVGEVFDHSVFQHLLKTYTKQKKGIGFQAFKAMWQKNKIYWEQIASKYYLRQDLFVLSVHSKHEINLLIKNNIGTDLNNRAHCQTIQRYGVQIDLPKSYKQYAKVIYLQSKSHIIQYMVESKFQRKILVTIDCSDSQLFNFMPASGKISYELDSGEKRFLMKLTPKEKSDEKNLIRREKISIKAD